MKALYLFIALSCSVWPAYSSDIQAHIYYFSSIANLKREPLDVPSKIYPLSLKIKENIFSEQDGRLIKKIEHATESLFEKKWSFVIPDQSKRKAFFSLKKELEHNDSLGSLEIISYAHSKITASLEMHDEIYHFFLHDDFQFNQWIIYDRTDRIILLYFEKAVR